ncbi:monocarboxylate transporter 12-B-like [Scomber scombrus]|uniref:monocarboxylate transporter 12-B-like n=1 Tax=Scomber scombrus TaxID=13677 RepID=UPI002DDAC4D9|nr:monocarboxylate transporter 12-B-like [Scomber scombrus]
MAVIKEEKLEEGKRASRVATPPEGGWGWMIVAGCFLANICTRAVTRCVSMFFVEFQLHFNKDYSTTSWIHSLVDSTTMLCAPLGGFLGTRLSIRATMIIGGLLSSTGLVLSSFATSLEYLYASMGVMTGLGFALCYTTSIAMVGMYFEERKALAYGIALSGSGIGTFILAPVFQLLIEHYSWRGALLVMGGFVANLCVCGAVMRPVELRRGDKMSEDEKENPEKDCMDTVLDSKDTVQGSEEPSESKLDINHLNYTEGLLIANGALKNCEQGNVALLPNQPDTRLTDTKTAECILFSNKLNATISGDNKLSDPQLANGSTIEDLNLNNKASEVMDTKTEDSGFSEADPADASPRGLCCSVSWEEYSFLFTPNFLIFCASCLFMAYGCSAPVVYLVPYAIFQGVTQKHAAFLMSIFGVCGIVGNITFGWLTDTKLLKKYRLVCYMVAVGMEGLCCLVLPLLNTFPLLVMFSVVYGYFDGAYVALIPVVASDVVDPACLTPALGVVYFLHAIPFLISPPIGGWLVDTTGNYTATFFLCGACFIFSALILGVSMLARRCRRSKSNSDAVEGRTTEDHDCQSSGEL